MNIFLFKKRLTDLIATHEAQMCEFIDTRQRIKWAQEYGLIQGLNIALRLASEGRERRYTPKEAEPEETADE